MISTAHNNFTLLRVVLATLVVLGHYKLLPGITPPKGIFSLADFAVDAFFVVSGYLVYGSYDKQQSLGSFYIRRLFRIYPLYFVTVVVQGIAMAIVAGGIFEHGGELLRYLGLNLIMANFLAHDLGGVLGGLHNPGINPSLWTLKIEVAFYVILPLLWHLTRRSGLWFLVALYIASSLFVALMEQYGSVTLAKQLPGQLRFFAVGMALYRYRDALRIPVPLAFVAAVVLFALCTLRSGPVLMWIYPILVGLLVFICALRLPALPLRFDISYGVYLFHGPLIQFALLLGIFSDTPIFLFLLLACVFLLAFIAERFIEQPGIELGKRLAKVWTGRRHA